MRRQESRELAQKHVAAAAGAGMGDERHRIDGIFLCLSDRKPACQDGSSGGGDEIQLVHW
jgi:hypothetical protein